MHNPRCRSTTYAFPLGLFVVVVNPYKRYPLYTHRVCKIYLGKRRNECPPHLVLYLFTTFYQLYVNCLPPVGHCGRRIQEHAPKQEEQRHVDHR